MTKILITFITSFFIAMVIGIPFIYLMKKIKAKQTILSYVEHHKQKEGIPTMGGVIFLVTTLITCLIFWKGHHELSLVALVVIIVYGGIGALDDGIKIILKRNLGLKAYQKIISQAMIAILITIYAYNSEYISESILIPIWGQYVSIGSWYIPLCFIIFIATTNCVNLTDGLDGLAGSSVCIYLSTMFVMILAVFQDKSALGQTFYAEELFNLLILVSSLIGSLLGFLWFNSHKAKIFMGDTGSLALGGACAILPVIIKNPFIIILVGIMFVVSGISVIIQVIVYKLKKKRVFLMAPFHHHLEMKGYNESKIVSLYSIVTAVAGVVGIIIS